MLHLRRVAQKVCCIQMLRQNGADLQRCVDRTLFLALDVQRQAVAGVVAVNDYRDFKEGEEVLQLLPNLTMSLLLVEVRFSTCQFIKAIDQRSFIKVRVDTLPLLKLLNSALG